MSKPDAWAVTAAAARHVGNVFVAAEVGGTHARLALLARDPAPGSLPAVLDYQVYEGAQWPGLLAIFQHFMKQAGGVARHGVLAIAGYVLDDQVVNRNLPWPVSLRELREGLGLERLEAVNDLEAIAYAAGLAAPSEAAMVLPARAAERGQGPLLVMGAGTGFGMAALLREGEHVKVLPTESGHISLAPGNDLEVDVLRLLLKERGRACYEDLLSGPGVLQLYLAICRLQGVQPRCTRPASVSAAAVAGDDPQARLTLDTFCGLLGSFAADLALAYRASGVYLAGGVLLAIRPLLIGHDAFASRFLDKGVVRPFLETIDVRLVEHERWGVLGAAGLFVENQWAADRAR